METYIRYSCPYMHFPTTIWGLPFLRVKGGRLGGCVGLHCCHPHVPHPPQPRCQGEEAQEGGGAGLPGWGPNPHPPTPCGVRGVPAGPGRGCRPRSGPAAPATCATWWWRRTPRWPRRRSRAGPGVATPPSGEGLGRGLPELNVFCN